MASVLTPFNVRLLQLTETSARNLRPITTLDTFDGATKNFNTNGLFSNEIFGANGDKIRLRRFAYIDMKLPIMHPLVFRTLGRLKRIYPEIMAGKTYAVWDDVAKDFVKSDPIDGQTGYHFFIEHFDKIQFPQRLSDLRELNIKFIERVRSTSMNSKLVVSPAGFRDYVIMSDGREEEDEVNKLYRKMIAFSNAITPEMFKMSPTMYDRVRFSMQSTFNAIYEYHENMIKGKHKLLLGRVMTRQVRDGTRNVITTQNLEVKELFGEGTPTTNSTGIGLFQYIKAFRPMCLWYLQNGYLKNVFSSPGAPARMVNAKLLHAEQAQLPLESYDLWMTKEGLEKLFNLFGEEERRHQPIMIDGYYLALVYNDGKQFKLFSDINELPEGFDRKHVKPVSFAEFIYSQVYQTESKVAMVTTRFPVTGFGSIYPTKPFLKVTMRTNTLVPLDDNWQPQADVPKLREFPIRGEPFVNTLMPPPDKLKGATADFDGDKMTGNGIYTKEGFEEAEAVMHSRNFHVKTDGSIAHSLATDTVEFLFGAMTGAPVLPVPAETVAKEAYQETGHFHSNGKDYDLNVIFRAIEEQSIPVKSVLISRLTWAFKYDKPRADRVAKADISAPIIVLPGDKQDLAVDGLHRLAKASTDGNTHIPAYVITQELFDSAEIKPTQAKEYIDNLTGRDMSIIRLGDEEYCPGVLYKNVNKHDQMPVQIAISDIGYARTNMRVPQEVIDAAKVNSPILVERIELEDGKVRYHAIYGFDILIKATQQGETQVNAYVISEADLAVAKIVPETA